MNNAPTTVLHRWFDEVWNQGREDAIDTLMAPDAIVHGLAEGSDAEIRGPAGFKPFFRKFRTAFPDLQIAIEDAIAVGDRVAVRCTVTATHTGPGVLPAPTGKPTQFSGMCIVRVKDGKIAEGWNNFDFLSLYHQLGLQLT